MAKAPYENRCFKSHIIFYCYLGKCDEEFLIRRSGLCNLPS